MHGPTRYEAQRASARRAFARVFVSGLARRMVRTGTLRLLARTVGGQVSSLLDFPTQHLRALRVSANEQPLRLPGVAAGGAGGGGPGARGNVVSFPA